MTKVTRILGRILNYPDFDVELTYMVFKRDGIHTPFPDVYNYKITGIADIGHSDKVIVLNGESGGEQDG